MQFRHGTLGSSVVAAREVVILEGRSSTLPYLIDSRSSMDRAIGFDPIDVGSTPTERVTGYGVMVARVAVTHSAQVRFLLSRYVAVV